MSRLARAKALPSEAAFGSEMAERLGLAAEDVAAIVGTIVGGAAAAFVIGRFEAGQSLPLMLFKDDSIDPTIEQLLSAGAARIMLATNSPSIKKDPDAFIFAGVRFSAVYVKDRREKIGVPG